MIYCRVESEDLLWDYLKQDHYNYTVVGFKAITFTVQLLQRPSVMRFTLLIADRLLQNSLPSVTLLTFTDITDIKLCCSLDQHTTELQHVGLASNICFKNE